MLQGRPPVEIIISAELQQPSSQAAVHKGRSVQAEPLIGQCHHAMSWKIAAGSLDCRSLCHGSATYCYPTREHAGQESPGRSAVIIAMTAEA